MTVGMAENGYNHDQGEIFGPVPHRPPVPPDKWSASGSPLRYDRNTPSSAGSRSSRSYRSKDQRHINHAPHSAGSSTFAASSQSLPDMSEIPEYEVNSVAGYSNTLLPDGSKASVDENNLDGVAKTATRTKFADEFLRNVHELVLQNPASNSSGWHTSNGLEYIPIIRKGEPYLWIRQTGQMLPLENLLQYLPTNKGIFHVTTYKNERLDPAFRVQHTKFFSVGKVFAFLNTQPCAGSVRNPNSPRVSSIMYGEKVYSEIILFVVVRTGKGFCYSCPIQTYKERGQIKGGWNASEHAIAYVQGSQPTALPYEEGMTKDPIEIIPTTTKTETLGPWSRIHFGRVQVVQHNMKVKEVGNVREDQIPLLRQYFQLEVCGSSEKDVVNLASAADGITSQSTPLSTDMIEREVMHVFNSAQPNLANKHSNATGPRRDIIQIHGVEYVIISEVGGQLHSGFDNVRKPRSFFKKGRCFMVFWPDLAGSPETERTIYWKIRRFVVIRARSSYCLCLPISTYQGQGTMKAGVAIHDHAPIIPVGGALPPHAEQERTRPSLYIKVEDPSVSVDPASRINLAKIYTVEYNVKVRNVGRIISESVRQMEESFADAARVG